MADNYRFETLQVRAGQEQPDSATDARAVPIYASASFVFHDSQHAADRFALKDAGNIYGRLTNPTQDIFERRMAALEGGVAALATASGAAAVTYVIQALAHAGEYRVLAEYLRWYIQSPGTHTAAVRYFRKVCRPRAGGV